MHGVVQLIAIAALAALAVGSIYAVVETARGSDGLALPLGAAFDFNANGQSSEPLAKSVNVVGQFCSANASQVLLSLPADADFTMGASSGGLTPRALLRSTHTFSNTPGPESCAELGTAEGRTLVLCRGQGPARFAIAVRAASVSQLFMIGLPACVSKAGSPTSRAAKPNLERSATQAP